MKLLTIPAFCTLLAMSSSMQMPVLAAQSALPQDLVALMALGHEKNGLVGQAVKPWHIRGTYRSFDVKGKLDYEGTYEEWWFSATQYKLSFTNPKSSQTDYATGTVLLRDGLQEWQGGPELLLRGSLIEPLPEIAQLKEFKLLQRAVAVGKSSMECVNLTYPLRANLNVSGNYFPSACFDPSTPVLRFYSEGPSTRIFYNRFVSFQGHYLARQVQVMVNGKVAAEMSLDVVELLKEKSDNVLNAPATAVPVDLTKVLFKNAARSHWPSLLKKAVPVYPQEAKSMGIQGQVNIIATIGTDGHVDSMQPMDGPSILRQSALDSVRQWLYIPFYVMGQPRPVQVELHVIFTLG